MIQLNINAGVRNIFVKVHVHDAPGPVSAPVTITGVSSTKCLLSFGPPAHNGGAKVTGYKIEKRETSRLSWLIVEDNTQDCCVKITGLVKNNEYVFRVASINQNGIGPYTESSAVIAKDAFTVSSEPGVPSVDNILNDCLLYTSPSPRDVEESRMPSSA